MADLKFSRIGGFRFDDVLVDNTNDIVLINAVRPLTANQEGYRQIDLTVGIYAKTAQERREKQRYLLGRLINKVGKLSFLDDYKLYYEAYINNEIQVNEGIMYTELTIPFRASANLYGMSYEEEEAETKLPIKLNTGQGNYKIYNYGNDKAIPIMQTTGNINVTIGSYAFTITAAASEVIYADTKNMVVYSVGTGGKVSKLEKFKGVFPVIEAGENNVVIGGTGRVKILFRDTYIV